MELEPRDASLRIMLSSGGSEPLFVVGNLDYSFRRRLRTLAAIGLGLRLWPHLGQLLPVCTI